MEIEASWLVLCWLAVAVLDFLFLEGLFLAVL
jgi:hypothetical protein